MTTIAFRDGILAADSRAVWADSVIGRCMKLYRVRSKVDPVKGDAIVGIAGVTSAAMLFIDWLEVGGEPRLHDRGVSDSLDFECLLVHKSGLWCSDRLCRLERVDDDFMAIGSGRMAALGAMHAGKGAIDAVRIATRIDPNSGGRVVSMTLAPIAEKPRGKKTA